MEIIRLKKTLILKRYIWKTLIVLTGTDMTYSGIIPGCAFIVCPINMLLRRRRTASSVRFSLLHCIKLSYVFLPQCNIQYLAVSSNLELLQIQCKRETAWWSSIKVNWTQTVRPFVCSHKFIMKDVDKVVPDDDVCVFDLPSIQNKLHQLLVSRHSPFRQRR